MMTGTIRINIWIGVIAFLVTLLTAFSGNVITVSLERAVWAFILFFLGMFPIRWGLHLITTHSLEQDSKKPAPTDETQKIGEHIDLMTPDSDSSTDDQRMGTETLSEDEPSDQFIPLTPRKLEPNPAQSPENDPTTITNVIRRLTDE
ncbi:hypothetical protein ACQCN2_13755 [Brevibacillus ginsengisoli]|uniref:hypothetical protein n=1 Tax=Brevibacillus ginsengisoli TaxID=363854 RepID=UPI003CF8E44B